LYHFCQVMNVVLGLDIGGTKLAGGLLTRDLRLLHRLERPSRAAEGVDVSLPQVWSLLADLVVAARFHGSLDGRDATDHISELMAALHERYPDDRQRSLFASVELSLRRLPNETRRLIRRLGVFQCGGSLPAIQLALGGVDQARRLVDVGLAELLDPGYLRFDPALAPALLREVSEPEREAARAAWAEAMAGLAAFLDQHQHRDPRFALTVAVLELPNLLAALEHLRRTAPAERVVKFATHIEPLLSDLGRPKALGRVAEIRGQAARQLGGWSHARCLAESAAVDRLLDEGRFTDAIAAARALLAQAQAAGGDAYAEAAYDLAMTHFRLGRALHWAGAAGPALESLREARRRFQALEVDSMASLTRLSQFGADSGQNPGLSADKPF